MFQSRGGGLAACLAFLMLGTLGCRDSSTLTGIEYSNLRAMHGQPAASSPPLTVQWPSSVPAFDSGDLILATADGYGVATALWETTHSAGTALQRYHARLLARGFQSDAMRVFGDQYVRDYRQATRTVRVIAHRRADITELTVTVRSS